MRTGKHRRKEAFAGLAAEIPPALAVSLDALLNDPSTGVKRERPGKHARDYAGPGRRDTLMNEITADLEKLVTDLEAAASQLSADGKSLGAAAMKLVSAQAKALLSEIENLIGKL